MESVVKGIILTHSINNVICLPDLTECVFAQDGVCDIADLVDNRCAENEAHSVNIVENAWNQLSEENHILPVRLSLTRKANDVIIAALIALHTNASNWENCC